MNMKRLLKALGLALALIISMQAAFQGAAWVLIQMPKWMSILTLGLIALIVCTACFYKALKIKESLDE